MTTQPSNIPISVDYTSRDYYSLREDLIARIKARIPQWTGNDPADFGVAIVEAFAYLGDNINYYIDRVANELNIETATQRQSILNIADSYGYVPTGYRSSVLNLQITNNRQELSAPVTNASGNGSVLTYTSANAFSAGQLVTVSTGNATYNVTQVPILSANSTSFTVSSAVTTSSAVTASAVVDNSISIPAGSQFLTEVVYNDAVKQLVFTVEEDLLLGSIVNGVASPYVLTALQKESIALRSENESSGPNDIAGELLGSSNGLPSQSFRLKVNQVLDSSVEVYVQNGTFYEKWAQVQHLTDYGPNDAVFSLSIDENNFVSVIFGDGVSGAIPPNLYPIKSVYAVSDGSVGNIAVQQKFSLYKIPSVSSASVSAIDSAISIVNTSVGVGGADPESTQSIRRNAPLALSTQNRAVTLKDYANLALTVPNVGKANAEAEIWNSVNVYVSAQRNSTDVDFYPGFASDGVTELDESILLRSNVADYLSDKIQIGVTVTVSPVSYVPVNVGVSYTKTAAFTTAQVEANILTALLDRFGYTQMLLADTIFPEEIEYRLRNVEGVENLRVTSLYRHGGAAGRNVLIGDADEVFVVSPSYLSLTPYSSVSNLSNLTFGTGTLSPSFSAGFYNYNLTVSTGTSSVNITPTNATASISVNGTAMTSGSATSVSLPTTTTNLVITSIAQNNITKSIYKVTVTKV
jgi:hypothetical protein